MAKKASQAADDAAKNGKGKARRHRSPNYPALNLRAAVAKLPKLFEAMKRHPVGIEVAVSGMDYSYSSSTGKLALASMRAYGLFENVATGAQGTVKLSTRALDIATDYRRESSEWWAAVKKAALAPSVHAQLWEKYGPNLPSDDELRRYLVRELKFNDNAVDGFIQDYKDTISFAKLDESDIIKEGNEDGDEGDETTSQDDRGRQRGRLKRKREMSSGHKEDVCSLEEGEAVFQWPENLSVESAQDLDEWLTFIGKKVKRAAGKTPPDDPGGDGEGDND